MKINKISKNCIELAKISEGEVLHPYQDSGHKIWTIGIGSTYYENGAHVKSTDPHITKERADELFMFAMDSFTRIARSYIISDVNQNQFDALVDFTYNAGPGNFKTSTLLTKVNKNPNDPSIRNEFNKWIFSGDGTHNHIDDDGDGLIDEPGEKSKINGLVKRRKAEADLYFS